MDSSYDEDLSENVFFKVLQNDYYDLFEKATCEGWIICVPRAGSMPEMELTPEDLFSHILIPNEELPETHFRTLNDIQVRICNGVAVVESEATLSARVLFEETYYTSDMLKYKVLCVEFPLRHYSDVKPSGISIVNNLRDSIDLLWTQSCKEVLEKMDETIQTFLTQNDKLEHNSLHEMKNLVESLYLKCLKIALKDPRLKQKSVNRHLLDNVKVSVESYVHHGIYDKLMKGITACTATEDAQFNKIVRNVCDIQLRDLKIGSEFQSVIPKARSELRKVDGYSTVVGKIGCLKKTICAISNEEFSPNIVAADELIPMFVFLVIKSGIPNWTAQLTFVKEFSYSNSNYHSNHQNFLVTSLEAAVTFIKTDLKICPFEPESQLYQNSLFDLAKNGDVSGIQEVLNSEANFRSLEGLNLCHPLCSCEKCENELSRNKSSVDSCDERGCTALHVAAMYGHPKVIDALISLGANVNKSDFKGSTPLHYSSSRGHQNSLLILIYGGASLEYVDNEGNTALHLAAINGHENCVKAILYHAEQTGLKLNIDRVNNQGETALHNASRWGFSNITSILLEYGASPFVKNKRKLTPQDVAHNIHILSQLVENETLTFKSLDFEGVNLKPNSIEEIRKIERVHQAIAYGDVRLACFYLGIDMNHNLETSCHPLCPCKKEEKVKDPLNVNMCDAEGQTALHIAAKYGRTELVRLLIESNADVNSRTAIQMTPFHLACRNQKFNTAKALLESGLIEINSVDSFGNTGLHYAVETNSLKLIQLLLDKNARKNIKNVRGQTPLDIAQELTLISAIQLMNDF